MASSLLFDQLQSTALNFIRQAVGQFTEGRLHYGEKLIKYVPLKQQATKKHRYLKSLNAKKK